MLSAEIFTQHALYGNYMYFSFFSMKTLWVLRKVFSLSDSNEYPQCVSMEKLENCLDGNCPKISSTLVRT